MHVDMETQIHHIEQEAYSSVLRAFKAQSDAITWEKESLITELRKELRVSDEEHRELLSRVNADDIIRRIREWRKKPKTSQSVASLAMVAPPMQPSSSTLKRGPATGARGKKPKGISPQDIRWDGEDPGISRRGGRSGPGRGFKKFTARGGAGAGRGRGARKGQSQNSIGKKAFGDIEILHTDTLIKEVEKVFGASQLDPVEVEKAKKVLKEQEQALLDAIARLEDASDGESDGEHHLSQGILMDQEQSRKQQLYDHDHTGEGRVAVEGSDGNKAAREVGMGGSHDQHQE